MVETIINNLEDFIVKAIEVILVIAVVLQRTKISRKVKEMEDTLLKSLTVEQLEAELKKRKEIKLEQIEPEEEDDEKVRLIEQMELKSKLHNIVSSIDMSAIYEYFRIKNDIKELRKHRDKFAYPERIEKLLNDEEMEEAKNEE